MEPAAAGDNSGEVVYDVVVVGAGIMGSCAAYEVARRGRTVLLLEQFDLLHHRGSSHGESRTLRATYPEPYYPAMVLHSLRLWESAQAEAGYTVLTRTPHLDLGPAADPSLLPAADNCRSSSLPVRILSPGDDRELFSGAFAIPDGWIGVVTQVGGVINPTKAVSMFQSLAIRRGAVVRDRTEVTAIERDEGGAGIRVSAKGGHRFRGRKCVVAAGAWTRKLVEGVTGRAIPIQPLHTTICYWRIEEGHEGELSVEGGFPTFSSYGDPYVYGTPSMEYPGLIKIALHGGYPCEPDDPRRWCGGGEEGRRRVAPWIERVMGGKVDHRRGPVMTQPCVYSMTPDGDFVVDFLGGELGEDVVVAGGFSGHGFKMGPVVGRVVADLALEGAAAGKKAAAAVGVELRHFSLHRFVGNPKGNPKDFQDQVCYHLPPPPPP